MTGPRAAPAQIEQLLEAQRTALLTADFATLEDLAAQLQAALDGIGMARLQAGQVDRIRSAAAHNARLIAAARSGISGLRTRRSTSGDAALTTYDASGRRHAGPAPGQTLTRR
jgi:hypothetical protein